MILHNTTRNMLIAGSARAASTLGWRLRGMLRRNFKGFDALVFDRCDSIHMFFMHMPLDVLFLDADGRVRGIRNGLRPWRLAFCAGAKTTIELPAGAIAASKTCIGDMVKMEAGMAAEEEVPAKAKRSPWRRWLTWALFWALAACMLAAWGATRLICGAAAGRTFDRAADVPPRKAALVLGCSEHLQNGQDNLFFCNRIDAAAELYKTGKARYLIVSGDNHIEGYDEPSDMKRALMARGVPGDAIYCDYAGFRTLDSVVRTKAIFGQDKFIVVSQKFHNERAIFLASHKGLDAVGFNARDVTTVRHGLRTHLREQFARIKNVLDVYVLRSQPKFYGPPVLLGPPQR